VNLSFTNESIYIAVIDEASDFKFKCGWGLAKAHHQIPTEEKWLWSWAKGAPQNLKVLL